MNNGIVRRSIIPLAMLAILLLFTFPMWSSSRLLYQGDLQNSDVTELNFPARHSLATSLKHGGLPIWNPHIGCGFPQLAEGQSGILYPFNLILFVSLNATLAFNLSVILSLLLALAFSYLLFRHYDISRPASLFSAVAFTFSAFVVAKLKFTYMVNCICWLPLAVYGVEKAWSARNPGFLLLTTLALAMQVLAGGPQILLITVCTVGVVFLWRLLSGVFGREEVGPSVDARSALYMFFGLLLCVLLALALAAPQLLPQLKGYPYTDRAMDQPFSWTLVKPMQPRNLVQFVSPYQYGNPARATYDLDYDIFWENVAYPGLLTLILVMVSVLFLSRRDRTAQMWLLIGALALALALGDKLPFAEFVWKYVPGFKMFRFWQRFLVVVVLAMAVLGGKGLDRVLSCFRGKRIWYGAMVALVFAVILADLGLFAYSQVSTIDSRRMQDGNRMAQRVEERLGDNPQGYRVAVLGQWDVWDEAYMQSGGWLGDKGLYYDYMDFLPPNHCSLYDFYGTSQYGDYGLFRFKTLDTHTTYLYQRKAGWEADITASTLNIMAMESTKYVITPFILNEEGMSEADSFASGIGGVDLRIYELADPYPRAYITQDYEVAEVEPGLPPTQITALMRGRRSAAGGVILEEEPLLSFGPGPAGEAKIASMDENRVVVEVTSPGGGMLVLNDAYYPEWHVYVDGNEDYVYRANIAFRAVELEPGTHRVEFAHKPSSFYYGIPVCAAGLLLIALLFFYHRGGALGGTGRGGADESGRPEVEARPEASG